MKKRALFFSALLCLMPYTSQAYRGDGCSNVVYKCHKLLKTLQTHFAEPPRQVRFTTNGWFYESTGGGFEHHDHRINFQLCYLDKSIKGPQEAIKEGDKIMRQLTAITLSKKHNRRDCGCSFVVKNPKSGAGNLKLTTTVPRRDD